MASIIQMSGRNPDSPHVEMTVETGTSRYWTHVEEYPMHLTRLPLDACPNFLSALAYGMSEAVMENRQSKFPDTDMQIERLMTIFEDLYRNATTLLSAGRRWNSDSDTYHHHRYGSYQLRNASHSHMAHRADFAPSGSRSETIPCYASVYPKLPWLRVAIQQGRTSPETAFTYGGVDAEGLAHAIFHYVLETASAGPRGFFG